MVKIGKQYGRLTVLKYNHTCSYGHKYFYCKCECGVEKIVAGFHLKSGNIMSCGCYNRDILKKRNEKTNIKQGTVYGKLTVLEYSYSGNDGRKYYKCKCKCGTIVNVRGSYLKNGNTKSCGCLRTDIASQKGEKHPSWKGGISYEPYCMLFNAEFKKRVRDFWNNTCIECGKTEKENGKKLCVHHVNFDKQTCCNDNKPLFVVLCASCHSKTNSNREYWEKKYTKFINEEHGGQCYLPKT